LQVKLVDYYDFDIESQKTLTVAGVTMLSDADMAAMHRLGVMQAFEVRGFLYFEIPFDCIKGTLYSMDALRDMVRDLTK
jgi:hypothetical protein